MGKVYAEIDDTIAAWIRRQKLFFIATSPLSGEGYVNCSPKGLDTLQIIDSTTLAYLDFGGSGIETVAHVKENNRIVIMMCAFEGPPKIFRFHGEGSIVVPEDDNFEALLQHFPPPPRCRCIITINLTRISDSCGYGVPLYDYIGERPAVDNYLATHTEEQIIAALTEQNAESIDGLSGLRPGEKP